METKIPGFEEYTVFIDGAVYRYEREVKPTLSGRGKWQYKSVRLWKNNKQYKRLLHKLVWEAFNGPVPAGFQVDHIDRDRMNNSLDNLRCVSTKENQLNRNDRSYFEPPMTYENFFDCEWFR